MGQILHAPLGMGRALRRRLEKLGGGVDRVTVSDRLFFERHPHRRHRLRIASRPEVEAMEITQGDARPRLMDGWRWYVLVKQVEPGVRLRLFIHNLDGEDTDVPEAALALIYENRARAGACRVEASLRAAVGSQPS